MSSTALQDRAAPSALRAARRALINQGTLPPGLIAPELARSWQRSWSAGLQPLGRTPGAPHASAAQLASALLQQRALVAHARPVMEFLFTQACDRDSMAVLASADGMLLHSLGDPQFIDRAERVALRAGANWHEQYRGTNAIGTALAEGCAVIVHADEHYLERNAFLTCAAAPIRDPQGRLLGALDVSGDQRGYHRHTLGLVRSAARMIEHRLFDTLHDPRRWRGLRLHLHTQAEGIGTVAEGLLALHEDGSLAGANATALELLGLDWDSLQGLQISQLLAEPLHRLQDWGQRGLPQVLHTLRGQVAWVRVEGSATGAARMAVPVSAPLPVLADDALAALDTGDAQLHAAISRARKVLDKPIALLLQGESGVGKELFAQAVHASSRRRSQAFVAVNCAALPENLIEAELFGYAGGAFTGARREGAPGRIRQAQGGTLFLDEIGDMPLALQARLLRVLQERQVQPLGGGEPVAVDFALICATHRDLPSAMAAGLFREDLYYRLNGFTLQLPALRQRSDLDALLERTLQTLQPERGIAVQPDLLTALRAYHWPGNMRQLVNALRTACALLEAQDTHIGWEHLPDDLLQALRRSTPTPAAPHDGDADLRSQARQAMERTLQACEGNMSEAARRLGVSRNTLYRALRARP